MQSIATRAPLAPARQFFCFGRVLTAGLLVGVMGLVVLPAACKSLSPPGDETASDSQSTTQSESDSDETSTLDSTVIEGDAQDVDYEIVAAMVDDDGTWLFSAEPAAAGGGGALTFEWDFGDGNVYYGQEQTYSLPNAGTYLIIVTGYKPNGHVSFVLSLELSVPGADQPPFADAGPDQAAVEGDQVTLDGSASSDPDENDSITFSWSQVAGDAVTLVNADTATPTFFVPPIESDGLLVFVLEVSDGWLAAQDTVVVEVTQEIDPAGGDTFDCTFTVAIDGDFDGPRVLTPFLEALVSGTGLPAGAVYTWTIDGEEESELVANHTGFTRSFQTVGVHTILLTLVVGDLSTACINTRNGASDEQVTVWPIVSGKAIDTSGVGIPAATVLTDGGGTTGVTEADGSYTVHVPYGWTGMISVDRAGYTFNPINFTNLIGDEPWDFVGQSAGSGDESDCTTASCDDGVACTDDACDAGTCHSTPNDGNCPDDGLFCNGEQVCNGVDGCVSTGDPCEPDQFCNEDTDTCDDCQVDSHCDDGNPCTNDTCDAGTCEFAPMPCDAGQTCSNGGCVDGQTIYGTITLVDTVGARPPIGQIQLEFVNNDGSQPPTFAYAYTDVNGFYTHVVPNEWRGTVKAGDDTRVFLLTPADEWTFGTDPGDDAPPVSDDVELNFTAWTAPIGIPGPAFGIKETHWMYQLAAGEDCTSNPEKCFDFGNGPQPYPDAGNGPYTHYVDNTHANATDNNNPFGTPNQPRLTIPWMSDLPSGILVYIHTGTYAPNDIRLWHTPGTAAAPVFITGNPVDRPVVSTFWDISDSSHVILENLDMDGTFNGGTAVSLNPHRGPVDHIVVRNCEIHHKPHQAGSAIIIGPGSNPLGNLTDILVYNNNIHDIGDWLTNEDPNDTGVLIRDGSGLVSTVGIWILDNEISYTSADAMGIDGGYTNGQYTTHHVYFGRNVVHHNRQGGGLTKMAEHVIFTQNVAFGHHLVSGSDGHGFATDRSPHNTWFIFNRSYDNNAGIGMHGEEPPAPGGGTVYIIGNLIYNIHAPGFEPENPWGGAAIHARNNHFERYIIGNTIYDVDGGIYSHTGGSWFIHNNIIDNVRSDAYHIFLDDEVSNTTWDLRKTLFYQPSGPIRIRWRNSVYTSLSVLFDATGQGALCLEADPRFGNPGQSDFDLLSDSPAIDAGLVANVYATFFDLYGIDIQVDIDGFPRPLDGDGSGNAEWDMGAFEYEGP